MGDIADMMLDGILCEGCGVYLDGIAPGYPRYCHSCSKNTVHSNITKPARIKIKCRICGKPCKGEYGLSEHVKAVHPTPEKS